MNKKLIISERQLHLITKEIDNSINETIIEEGFKDIALGLLMLAGLNLSGQNKAIAQKALTNPEIIQKIDTVLSDTTTLNKVIDKIENKLPNAGEIIQKNADKIKSTIDYIEAKNSKTKKVSQTNKITTTSNPKELISKLRQGYAISDIKITKDTILPEKSIVVVQDTIDFTWSSDNFFKTAQYQLSDAAKDSLSKVISEIKANGGKIIGVNIESSTDKEPIKMGNDKLSELRANSVKDYISKLDIGNPKFNIVTKPNSGPNLYNKNMSKEERISARIKTAPYRYVKISLIVVFEEEVPENATAPQVIEKHEVELVKILTNTAKTVNLKYKGKVKNSKCKGVKINDGKKLVPTKCYF